MGKKINNNFLKLLPLGKLTKDAICHPSTLSTEYLLDNKVKG